MRQAFALTEATSVDHFFGGREWRDLYDRWQRQKGFPIHRYLLDLYRSKLQALGYVEVRWDDETGYEPLIRNAQRRAPMYRLLFASKHPLGHHFWEEVTRRDESGQLRMKMFE